MLSFFRFKPLIDPNSAEWIITTFAWALKHFDRRDFFEHSQLVQPNNDFFPGRVSSVEEKADNIFAHTLRYAGLQHWPFELKPLIARMTEEACQRPPLVQTELASIVRHSGLEAGEQVAVLVTDTPLYVFYNPQQTLKPEDMAASYAQVIGQHLMIQSQQLPPGGADYFAEAAEIVAHMLGFGVLLSNSAYTFRGGCGSCYNAMANRQPALNELESVFTLALYCRLKQIDHKVALRHLKKHLHASFKRAAKQIERVLQQPEGAGAELMKITGNF